MEYDDRGNLTKVVSDGKTISQYEFDATNKMTGSINKYGIVSKYDYDGAGRRIKMSVELPKVKIPAKGKMDSEMKKTCDDIFEDTEYKKEYNYINDVTSPYSNVLMVYGKHNETQRYTYGLDVLSVDTWKSADTFSADITSGKAKRAYYLQDELGSPIKLLDESGKVKASFEYDAFGKPLAEAHESELKARYNIFSYTGYQFDETTGLMFAQARYYMPEVGRFISEDPIGAGLNGYIYCNNNPVRLIDPLGLESIVVSGEDYSDDSVHAGFSYNFIEPALKKLGEIRASDDDETIAWLIADAGWSSSDWDNFSKVVGKLNVSIVRLSSADDLVNYVNNKTGGDSRTKDEITSFTVFSHGFEGKLSLGYNYDDDGYNKSLDFSTCDIDSIHSYAFDNPTSWFYSCKTGTGGNNSFAQAWANQVGGTTWAYKGRTTYEYMIFPRDYPRGYTLGNLLRKAGLGKWADFDEGVEMLRKSCGFSFAGSIRYPEAGDGTTLLKFTR